MGIVRRGSIELRMPGGWVEAENSTDAQVIVLGPIKGDRRPTFTVAIDRSSKSTALEAYANAQEAELGRVFGSVEFVRREAATAGPHEGQLRELRFTFNGRETTQFQFYALTPDGIAIMTFSCLTSAAYRGLREAVTLFASSSFKAS